MIEDLKPYPEYKDSGLPWVGPVPKHWDLIPNRALVKRKKVLVGERHAEYRLLSLTKQGVIVRDISNAKGKFSSDMGTSQEVREGEFVFCLFDVPETPRTVGLSNHAGMITGAYTVFEHCGRGNPWYFEKYYIAMDDNKLLSPLYSGLRHTVPVGRLLGTKTPQPPYDEQLAIVRFLASLDRRVNRLVRTKRRLIELLNEQKQALITHAVTRGLNPNAKLKPSGIDWLGNVPEHWEAQRLRHLVKTVGGMTPSKNNDTYWNGEVPWVSPKDMKSVTIGDSIDHITSTALTETNISVIKPPAVLIVVRGMILARMFPVSVTEVPVTINQDMKGLMPRATVAAIYLRHVLSGLWSVVKSLIEESGHGTRVLRTELWRNLLLPVPPLPEQAAICAHIAFQTEIFDNAVAKAKREIDLLREYRTRLVADVVTGKLDVRDAARNLPDDDEPAEPLDGIEDDITESDDLGEESAEEMAVAEDA